MPQLSFERCITNAQGIHGDVKVFAFLYPIADGANVRQHFFDRLGLVRRPVQIAITHRLIDYKLDVGLGVSAEPLILGHALLSDEFIRIRLVRENQNFDLEVFGQKDLDGSLRCLHTRAVAIIIDHHLVRKTA